MVDSSFYNVVGFESLKVFARDSPYGYVCVDTKSQEVVPCPYHSPLGDIFLFMVVGLFGSIFVLSLAVGLWFEFLEISEGIRRRVRSRRIYEPLAGYGDLEKNSVTAERCPKYSNELEPDEHV